MSGSKPAIKPLLERLWRDLMTVLMIAIPVVLLGGFVWLTNAPDAQVFVGLSRLPLVGEPVVWLRDHFRGPLDSQGAPAPPFVEGSPADVRSRDSQMDSRMETVFVGGGAVLRGSPESDAPELARTDRILTLRLLERRGRWVEVEWPSPGESAWVDLEAKRVQNPPLGSEPDPPGPLPGRAADSAWVELAERVLGPDLERARLGPYDLRHDLGNPALLERLERTLADIEQAYTRRYGVIPSDRARETIVVFRSKQDYQIFRDNFASLVGLDSAGHTTRGLVVLHADDPDPRMVEQILIHEITHQLNRRALGPALPAWLEEGLCEEFSELGYFVATGREEQAWIRSFRIDLGDHYRLTGAYSSLEEIAQASLRGNLPTGRELVALDWRQFVGLSPTKGSGALHYATSGWLLRYLIAGEEGRHRGDFERYLQSVALGEPPSGHRLIETLDIDWAELDAGFRSYLFAYARELAVPAVSSN